METILGQPPRGKSPLPELEDHLGYWLRRVSNHVSGAFAHALQERQVSVAEWVALRLIYEHENFTPGQMAEEMGFTRGAVSKVVDKLEVKGWVARSANPEDSRVRWLSLTRQGSRLLPILAEIADGNDEHFFGCLAKGERASLKHLLQKLTDFHCFGNVPVD